MTSLKRFEQVSVDTKANIYFDGNVISHSLWFSDGSKKTLGLIYPGSYHFNTDAPERMDILSGECRVKIATDTEWQKFGEGQGFDVPGKSGFDIEVSQGIAEYLCSFLPHQK